MPARGRRSEAGAPSALVGSAPRLEPPVSGWGYDVRSAERCACRSGDRRSKPGVPRGEAARRVLRACGPRAGLKTGGPSRHAITEGGTFQAGGAVRGSSDTRSARLRRAVPAEAGVPSRVRSVAAGAFATAFGGSAWGGWGDAGGSSRGFRGSRWRKCRMDWRGCGLPPRSSRGRIG